MIPHCTTSLQNWTILHHSAYLTYLFFPLFFVFYFVSSTFMGGADGPWATGLSLSLQRRGAQLRSCAADAPRAHEIQKI